MSFGICHLSVIAGRKEPSDKSEMVTQLLFGEHFEILDERKNWTLVRIAYDGYECWIGYSQFLPLLRSAAKNSSADKILTTEPVQVVYDANGTAFPVLLGSTLPGYKRPHFYLGNCRFTYEGEVTVPGERPSGEVIAETALLYLHAPYLWGGKTPFGIDCSGFAQMVFKIRGVALKRDAWQQEKQGTAVDFIEESQAGDLAFFDNEEGKIVHTGIILDNCKIIHASGKVRIDSLDHHGIYNEELKKYTHRLRIIKKII
jgi:hypothetical protein